MSKNIEGVSFECRSIAEADLIRNAVNRYARCVLKPAGIDPRNYAPANAEGAGFGWDALQRAYRDMGTGTVTHMSARMAAALRAALVSKAGGTWDRESRTLAMALVLRLSAQLPNVDRVTMREWSASGRMAQRELTAAEYGADMACNRQWSEAVCNWEGVDRNGWPLRVTWLSSPRFGPMAFYAYEING